MDVEKIRQALANTTPFDAPETQHHPIVDESGWIVGNSPKGGVKVNHVGVKRVGDTLHFGRDSFHFPRPLYNPGGENA